MEKKYVKPSIRVQEMLVENHLNAATDDPTKVPVSDQPVAPENADAKQVNWVDYLED